MFLYRLSGPRNPKTGLRTSHRARNGSSFATVCGYDISKYEDCTFSEQEPLTHLVCGRCFHAQGGMLGYYNSRRAKGCAAGSAGKC
jgi:hypothetical protein